MASTRRGLILRLALLMVFLAYQMSRLVLACADGSARLLHGCATVLCKLVVLIEFNVTDHPNLISSLFKTCSPCQESVVIALHADSSWTNRCLILRTPETVHMVVRQKHAIGPLITAHTKHYKRGSFSYIIFGLCTSCQQQYNT